MRILYYTPLKPPGHPVPSGDRAMARALREVLRRCGHRVRTLVGARAGTALPAPERQIVDRETTLERYRTLLAEGTAPGSHFDLFLTYHVYYKKPDWIGPEIARHAGVPYVLAEVSYAPKRAGGPWDLGHRQVATCIAAADLILNFNPIDANCVRPLMKPGARLLDVPPFIDTRPFAAAAGDRDELRIALAQRHALPTDMPWLLTVAMMRPGDKLHSYRILAEALQKIVAQPWRLIVVGDGHARAEVERAFAPLQRQCLFLGALPSTDLPALYAAADLYVWPAINEAWGMTLIEAQAAGLPVIAGRTGGVPNVVREGETGILPSIGDADAFAEALAALLADQGRRREMSAAARDYAAARHDRRAVGHTIDAALRALAEPAR